MDRKWMIYGGLFLAFIIVTTLLFTKRDMQKTIDEEEQVEIYEPNVAGKVSNIHTASIVDFVDTIEPQEIYCLVIGDNYNSIIKAEKLHRLLFNNKYKEVWESMFKNKMDKKASSKDLVNILLLQNIDGDIIVYTLEADKLKQPIKVNKYRFRSLNEAHGPIKKFYRRRVDDNVIIIVSGPDLDIDSPKKTKDSHYRRAPLRETPLSDLTLEETSLEDFGMYEGALPGWLQSNPCNSSVDRFTRNVKQRVGNVSSLNTAITPTLTDYIPYSEQGRFQTPIHYEPAVNPSFSNHLRVDG